jgi:hypothetical protein
MLPDTELRAQVEALTSALQTMRVEMDSLRSQCQSASPAATFITFDQLSTLPKEPHVSTPEHQHKTERRTETTPITEVPLKSSHYPNDYQNIGLIILSYLHGPTAKRARPYLPSNEHYEPRTETTPTTEVPPKPPDPDIDKEHLPPHC